MRTALSLAVVLSLTTWISAQAPPVSAPDSPPIPAPAPGVPPADYLTPQSYPGALNVVTARATADQGFVSLFVTTQVAVAKQESYTYTAYVDRKVLEDDGNGVKVEKITKVPVAKTGTRTVMHYVPVTKHFKLNGMENLTVMDAGGKQLGSDDIVKALEKTTSVIEMTGNPSAEILSLLKPETVVLVWKPQPPAPAKPISSSGPAPIPASPVPVPAQPAPGIAPSPVPVPQPPPLPPVPPQPTVVLAQAVAKGDQVTLTVNSPTMVCEPQTRTVAMEILRKVDGKDVPETVQKQVAVMVCKTVMQKTEIQLGTPGVRVTDLSGKSLSRDEVLQRLEKETAILRCVADAPGPVDPFTLRTTKPDTLILMTPGSAPRPNMPYGPGTAPAPYQPTPRPVVKAPSSAVDKPKGEFEPSATEQDVIDRTNAARKKGNLPPLTASAKLSLAAWSHSTNMAKQGSLSHTLDGVSPGQRVTEAGYKWSQYGENIAQGQRTPEEVMTSWMNSSGHRANILTKEFTEIGIAVITASDGRRYWTMVLARPR